MWRSCKKEHPSRVKNGCSRLQPLVPAEEVCARLHSTCTTALEKSLCSLPACGISLLFSLSGRRCSGSSLSRSSCCGELILKWDWKKTNSQHRTNHSWLQRWKSRTVLGFHCLCFHFVNAGNPSPVSVAALGFFVTEAIKLFGHSGFIKDDTHCVTEALVL